MSLFGKYRLAIDLGTSQTIIYLENLGVALREPSVVAYNTNEEKVIAYGSDALNFKGKTHENIEIIYPIKNGVIDNFEMTKKMLTEYIRQSVHRTIARPEVVISVPSSVTKVERRALIGALREIGIHRAMITNSIIATALGNALNINQPYGYMIVNIGGGSTEVGVVSYGDIISEDALPAAGHQMNRSIQAYVREHYNLIISETTAEEIKISIGNALYTSADKSDNIEVTGRSVASGMPATAIVQAKIVATAIEEVLFEIIQVIRNILELTAPELLADIARDGIYVAGGGALLKRLPERLSKELNTKVQLAPNPIDSVALGGGQLLKDLQRESQRIQRSRVR